MITDVILHGDKVITVPSTAEMAQCTRAFACLMTRFLFPIDSLMLPSDLYTYTVTHAYIDT